MRINTGTGTIPLMTLIAIWSVSAVISLPGLAISPILGDMDTIFPHASHLEIQMLTSLPSLLIIPFVLLSGRLSVGRDKIKILVIGLSLFFGSGLLYFFANSMLQLIIISCVLGIGAGMMIPLSTGLVVDYFSDSYRVKQLGLSSSITNITLVLTTFVTGYLADINWHYPFLVYTLPGGAIILSTFLRKNKPVSVISDKTTKSEVHIVEHINRKKLVQLMAVYFFITYIVLAIIFYLPFLVQEYKMESSTSGTMISLFFFAIMIPGLFLNKILNTVRHNTYFYSLTLMAIGLITIFFFKEKWLIIFGCLSTGLGYGVLQPLIYDKTARSATAKMTTYALSFVMAVNYLAIMVCPFIVHTLKGVFHSNSAHFPFLINAVLVTIVAAYAYRKRDSFALGLGPEYFTLK